MVTLCVPEVGFADEMSVVIGDRAPHDRCMRLQHLLRPRSIAVVGATDRTFIGRVALTNCVERGFDGTVVPVSRRAQVAGLSAVSSLEEMAAPVDLALVQVRAESVLDIVTRGVAAGVRGFVIPGAGYTDSAQTAIALMSGLQDLRRNYEFDVVGPNCMGVLDLVTGAAPYIGSVSGHMPRGTVGLIAQSGAIVEAFVNSGGRVGLSTAVSSGSEAVTSMADYLDFFSEDCETTAVLLFVETVGDAATTLTAIRKCSEVGKPVAACVVGRSVSGRAGVAAHSGRLAVPARVIAAALRQAGAAIADDLDELMTFGEIFTTRRPRPAGRRAHVVTNSGGEGNLIADIATDCDLQLPTVSAAAQSDLNARWPSLTVRNPLDPWGVDDYPAIFPDVIACAAAEPGDILIVAMDQHRAAGEYERGLGRALASYLSDAVTADTKLPVLISPVSDDVDPELVALCRRIRIPLLRGARPALSVLSKLASLELIPQPPTGTTRRSPALPADGANPSEDEALTVLAALGVATAARRHVGTPAEAAAAAAEMGPAVVLKGIAPGIIHKTELGLVEIAPKDVAAAAARMREVSRLEELTFLVAEMVRGQLEILVGYKRDAVFGPTMILALGGVWTEFLDTASVFVGALTPASAQRFLDDSTVGVMIANARGGRLCRHAVIAALLAVSDLAAANPDIVSIDVNPLIIGRDHATAVDAVIERQPTPHHSKEISA